MHEIGIAQELTELVLEVAIREKLSKVTKVNISFGRMVQIVPDIFDFAFRVTVSDTLASDAELSIELVPVKLKCRHCTKEFELNGDSFQCCICGSVDLDIIDGKSMFLKSIEGE